jgi:hypothetical protein
VAGSEGGSRVEDVSDSASCLRESVSDPTPRGDDPEKQLLDRTCRLREDSVSVGTDQPYCAHHTYQDHCQDNGVFSYVLTLVV